ncbi:MAG: hypothetical protein H6648_06845 [Caldilineae bacterium]|nr:hypothetical protein [Caldilineae bacterium]
MNAKRGFRTRCATLTVAIFVLLTMLAAGAEGSRAAPAGMPLGPWQMTGALATARGGHTATLLPDGSVLAIGAGGDATADPAEGSIERYDPVGGIWQALTSLRPPRRGHTATLLPDGRVLIAGGDGGMGQGYPDTALIFDPADDSLTPTGAMVTPRAFHSATLLPDGRVMVLGGGNPGFLDSIEVYDPVADHWNAIGALSRAREYHTATLLSDGSVLVAGGAGAGGRLTSIERVNPQGTATEVAQLTTPRGFHTATLLPDGDVLLIGGDGGGGLGFPPRAERYHPQTHGVVETAPLAHPRRHHTATLLPDGRVLVVGGDTNSPRADTEAYEPWSDRWTAGPPLNDARRLHTTTLLDDGSLLAAGGYGVAGWLSSAERVAAPPCDETIDIPVAQAQPDAGFATLLAQAGIAPGKRKGLGDPATDRVVAHSFTGLQRPGMRIAEAALTIVAEPGGWDASNDAFHILVARKDWPSSPRVGWFFDTGSGLPSKSFPWSAGDPGKTITTQLHVDAKAVLAAMNDDGRLDVFVQDDTTVQRMFLRLRYVCCDDWATHAAPGSQIGSALDAHLTAIGFTPNRRKAFGDATTQMAVGHTFDQLARPGTRITAAELTVLAQPGGSGSDNDAIFALVADGSPTPPAQHWFYDAGQASPNLGASWLPGGLAKGFTIQVNDPGVLAAMNASGRLDVYTQDDTTIYGLRLRTFHACCGDWVDLARARDAQPSAELQQLLAAGNFPALKGYGDATIDRVFADSFVGLQRPGMHVAALELVMHGTQGGSNDTISALVAGASPAARVNWWLASNWLQGQGKTPVLARDLSQSYTLLEAINQTGRLDVYVQDDGRVDSLELRLRYDCGPMPPYTEPGPKGPPSWAFLGQPRPDLWIDDTPHTVPQGTQLDTGLEPDTGMIGQPMWQSRAIWVRNTIYDPQSPHAACATPVPQNPMDLGLPITVCVRVQNIGQLPATGTLHLYWAKAALGLGWNTVPGSEPGTTNGDWTEIGATVDLSLDPGQSTVVGLPWLPPTPPHGDLLHACLLARIEAAAPDAIWDETTDVDHNTRWNNNIAWRNVQVEGLIVGSVGPRHPVILRNLGAVEQELAVRIRSVEGLAGSDFFAGGRLDLDMPAAIGDRWKAQGGPGRGFRIAPEGSAVIVDQPGGALIEGLTLAPGESIELGLRYARDAVDPQLRRDAPAAGEAYDVEVAQLLRGEDGTLREQGGVAYALRMPDAVPPSPTPTPVPTPSARLVNISTRAWVGTGDEVLIGGFIVAGGAADVLVRAIGPDLTLRGVPGALLDPWIEVYDASGARILTCDDWMTCPGAADLGGLAPADPREAALKVRFEPGAYTVIVRGKSGGTGVGLVEVFHAGGNGVLSNISTRGKVLTGDQVMIGGLIVRDAPGRVVFRGIGPDLTRRGVPGAMEDPWMEIYNGQGERILTCDDWSACPGAAELGALAPADPREPAALLRLAPGAYTAIVRGRDGGTGNALVEAFALR